MTEENTNTTEQQTAPTGDAPGTQAGVQQLTINDMIVLKNMVEICSSRGAFKADEMTTVGGVYNKLAMFIQAVMPQNPAPDTGNTAPATETTGSIDGDMDGGNVDMSADTSNMDMSADTGNVATDTGNVSGDSA